MSKRPREPTTVTISRRQTIDPQQVIAALRAQNEDLHCQNNSSAYRNLVRRAERQVGQLEMLRQLNTNARSMGLPRDFVRGLTSAEEHQRRLLDELERLMSDLRRRILMDDLVSGSDLTITACG